MPYHGISGISGQNFDQNHWFPYTNTTEMSPKPPNWNVFFSTSFWSKIFSRYTRTIYRSRAALDFRSEICRPMYKNHSQVLLKTEVLGKFQLWTREPPYTVCRFHPRACNQRGGNLMLVFKHYSWPGVIRECPSRTKMKTLTNTVLYFPCHSRSPTKILSMS